MKTSNKIIIAFSILFLSGIVTLFIVTKEREKALEKALATKSMREIHKLLEYSVVVAEDSSDVHIDYADNSSIEIELAKTKNTPKKLFKLQNDTLFVYKGARLYAKTKHLKSVIGNNHLWLGVFKFATDTVCFKLTGGETLFDNNGIEEKPFSISITATDSANVSINNINGKNISVNCYLNSKINFKCKMQVIKATIKEQSSVTGMNAAMVIDIKRDSSSSVQ